jgi:aspartyl protease family protein
MSAFARRPWERRHALRLALATLLWPNAHAAGTAAARLVLRADAGGLFHARGLVNGHAVDFLLDTGASAVTLGQAQAEALGLAWRDAPRALAHTALGSVEARLLELDEVQLGPLRAQRVGAAVLPAALPQVLLGNTFLGRFDWRREGALLTLRARR